MQSLDTPLKEWSLDDIEDLREYAQDVTVETGLGVRRSPMDQIERDLFGRGLRGYLRRAAFRKRVAERVAENNKKLALNACAWCGVPCLHPMH